MRLYSIVRVILPVVVLTRGLFAQTAASKKFDVSTVKPAADTVGVRIMMDQTGTLDIAGATLKLLVQQAFNVRDFQVSGGSAWVGAERWDIKAKSDASGTLPPDQLRPMLIGLLQERFELQTHRETKEMPVYELTIAKSGSKLAATAGEAGPNIRIGRGDMTAKKVNITTFLQILSGLVGRTIVDKTGLTGEYDLTLKWTPDPGQGNGPLGPPQGGPPPIDDGPTIFTAIQEQLGLKLEAAKGPVEIIVIDQAEHPSDN